MTPFHLHQKTILITGASSGIGAQTAISAAQMGATVILSGRNREKLEQVKQSLAAGEHSIVTADLTKPEDRDLLIQTIAAVDGIVHSAGAVEVFPVKLMNEEELERQLLLNYKAPFLITAGLSKNRKLNKGCSIVFISSISGQHPFKGGAVYAASKASIEALSKTIALEYSTQNIRSNCISPALVKTKILDESIQSLGRDKVDHHQERYPLGFGEPEDVANAAVFLLSDASKWITGTNLILDGGFLLNK
ncbi:MAG: family oxidoreductase [Cytophagaceae bacterium]|jgi:NAD(P)-dependent dehydrogenase (short-subunit alcohol dehydrogenase family)|nr:family oxidoreductase [Cytophagaceae bacterium]